jgi:hypothetical protein
MRYGGIGVLKCNEYLRANKLSGAASRKYEVDRDTIDQLDILIQTKLKLTS